MDSKDNGNHCPGLVSSLLFFASQKRSHRVFASGPHRVYAYDSID